MSAARWGANAKGAVRSQRLSGSAVETQKDEPKPVLVRSNIIHFPLNQESLKAIHTNAPLFYL